ncbi:MAG: TonB-dependent receptor [Thermodesulfobacteriota bacterium]
MLARRSALGAALAALCLVGSARGATSSISTATTTEAGECRDPECHESGTATHFDVGAAGLTLSDDGGRASLEELVVEASRPLSAASAQEIRARDFELRPHATTQEVLQNVPGLVVSQHQGGGKAMQYLIRGFDSDHGTDFALFVDGVPVNLVSHAHGQGYADLNYLIPETIRDLRLWKGPYFTQFGDFMNAGALEIQTRDEVAESSILLEGASFDTARFLAQASPQLGPGKTYLAAQAYTTNGPFENPQNFWAYNFFLKYTLEPTPTSALRASAIVYDADWDASGEIPLRAVRGFYPDGQPFTGPRLDRFGAIDPTEGGKTDYEALNLTWENALTPHESISAQAYGFRYRLALWSDFTFLRFTGLRFVEQADRSVIDTGDAPPIPGANYIPGDGIEQDDERFTYGFKTRWSRLWELGSIGMQTELGVENRNDSIDLALWRQVRRKRFFAVNRLHVDESSLSAFLAQQMVLTDWLRFEGGVRGDQFWFSTRDRLPRQAPDPNFESVPIDGGTQAGIVSPKANLILSPAPTTDVYLNFGTGFHSNDARVAVLAKGSGFDPLTRSIGAELGARTRVLETIDVAAALWWLDLDSELVFSGDAGVVDAEIDEPTGNFVPGPASRRWGVDVEARWQITDWLWADYDLGWADPRFRASGLAIPLAPTLLMNGGLTARWDNGLSAGLRFRFVGDRPANEERTLTAAGYFVMDALVTYRWRNVQLMLAGLNLTDADWREAQFADDTCLCSDLGRQPGCLEKPGLEPGAGVSDVHFTPGNPIAVRGGIQVFF